MVQYVYMMVHRYISSFFFLLLVGVFVGVVGVSVGSAVAQAGERPSWNVFSEEYSGVGVGYRVGVRFVRDVSVDVRGGYPEPSFVLKPGAALPKGVRLTDSGILAGMPTSSGIFRFSVIAQNTAGVAEKQIVLRIREPFSTTAVYQSGDLDPAIRDAQVFLNSTDCPVARMGVGSSRKEVLSFLPEVGQAVSCYQRQHNLPVTGTLTPAVFRHFVSAYNARFVPGDFTLPAGTLSSSKPQWRESTTAYTVTAGESVSRDLAGLLADGYPLPDFRVQSGSLPTGLSLRGDGMISGTPYSAGSATTSVVATNASGSAVLRVVWRVEEGAAVYSLGDTHPDIQQAQIYLNGTPCPVARAGLGSPGRETSYFGPATLRAVRCYQSLHTMTVTGTITPHLIRHLESTYDPGAVPEPVRESCAADTLSYCILHGVGHDTTAVGACADGYIGSCQYRCADGVWSQLSNSCAQPAAPASQDGVCDVSRSQGCAVGTPVQYDPSYIAYGERWRCRGANYGYSSEWCVRCDSGYAFDGRLCRRAAAGSVASPGAASVSGTGKRCGGTTVSYCRLGRGSHGNTISGVCSAGRTGVCQYTCNDGAWQVARNSCVRLSRCAAGTLSGCAVSESSHDTVSGSCAEGYTPGSCQYRCNDGAWIPVRNNCTQPVQHSQQPQSSGRRCPGGLVGTCRPFIGASSGVHVSGEKTGAVWCESGYRGTCDLYCDNGSWVITRNGCTRAPSVSDSNFNTPLTPLSSAARAQRLSSENGCRGPVNWGSCYISSRTPFGGYSGSCGSGSCRYECVLGTDSLYYPWYWSKVYDACAPTDTTYVSTPLSSSRGSSSGSSDTPHRHCRGGYAYEGCYLSHTPYWQYDGTCESGRGSCRYQCVEGENSYYPWYWLKESNNCLSTDGSLSSGSSSYSGYSGSSSGGRTLERNPVCGTIGCVYGSKVGGGNGSGYQCVGNGKTVNCRESFVTASACASVTKPPRCEGNTLKQQYCLDYSEHPVLSPCQCYYATDECQYGCSNGACNSASGTSSGNTNTTTNTNSSTPQWCWEGRCYNCDCDNSTQRNFSECRDHCGATHTLIPQWCFNGTCYNCDCDSSSQRRKSECRAYCDPNIDYSACIDWDEEERNCSQYEGTWTHCTCLSPTGNCCQPRPSYCGPGVCKTRTRRSAGSSAIRCGYDGRCHRCYGYRNGRIDCSQKEVYGSCSVDSDCSSDDSSTTTNTTTNNTTTNTNTTNTTTNTNSSTPQWCASSGNCYDCDCSDSAHRSFSECQTYCNYSPPASGCNVHTECSGSLSCHNNSCLSCSDYYSATGDCPSWCGSSCGGGSSPPSSNPSSPPASPPASPPPASPPPSSSPSCRDQNKLDLPCIPPFCGSSGRCVVCSSDGSCASYSGGNRCESDDDC